MNVRSSGPPRVRRRLWGARGLAPGIVTPSCQGADRRKVRRYRAARRRRRAPIRPLSGTAIARISPYMQRPTGLEVSSISSVADLTIGDICLGTFRHVARAVASRHCRVSGDDPLRGRDLDDLGNTEGRVPLGVPPPTGQ